MKKIICLVLVAIFALVILTEVTGLPVLTEVTGRSCGAYKIIPPNSQFSSYVNRVWYNKNWDCFCGGIWSKIPIWMLDHDTQEVIMAFTCKKV